MRPTRCLLLGVTLAVLAPAAAAATTVLDFQGLAWETGGFPPSQPGDTLHIPFVVNGLSPALGIALDSTEVTGWITGLVSGGQQAAGNGIISVQFSAARIEIFRDASRNHDYGEFPPGATVPATFIDGALALGGSLTGFNLFLDTNTGAGAYQGEVSFTEGASLAQLTALRADGFSFGGILTPQASGNNIPPGYDLSVDGFVEVHETPAPCPFACIGFEGVSMEFPRHPPKHFGPRGGEFHLEGVFTPCSDFGPLDPSLERVTVRIGSYTQEFQAGSLQLDADEDEQEWEFENERGVATITKLQIEHEGDGSWEFEIRGRGLQRQLLLGDSLDLVVELQLGRMGGTATARLEQKRHRLRFDDEHPCGHSKVAIAPALVVMPGPPWELVPAAPNPFNPSTTITLLSRTAGRASLRIFDVRGRLVRTLQGGDLPAGEHRFVWNGTDEQGQVVASGVYVYRAEAPGFAESRKMVLAK